MSLGLVAAVLVTNRPLVLSGVVVAMHRTLLLRQYQQAASADGRTGLFTK